MIFDDQNATRRKLAGRDFTVHCTTLELAKYNCVNQICVKINPDDRIKRFALIAGLKRKWGTALAVPPPNL